MSRDFEAILVDNGSTDGSVEFAEERDGDFIRIIRNKKNLGFTGGNNIGMRAARGTPSSPVKFLVESFVYPFEESAAFLMGT